MTQMAPLTIVPRRVRLRVEDYLSLDRAGAFAPYGKTELLDGEVVYMNAQHRPHGRVKMALYDALRDGLRATGSDLSVFVEVSVELGLHDAPEPDLTLTSDPDGDGLIPAASVALIVEVADATLRNDLGRKQRVYAAAGVPEYWVADVKGAVIHRLWQPDGAAYASHDERVFGDQLTAATIPGLTIATTGL